MTDRTPDGQKRWTWPLGPVATLAVILVLVSVLFLAVPSLDLWFTRQFYDAEIGFPATRIPASIWLRWLAGFTVWAICAAMAVSLIAKLVLPLRPSLIPARSILLLSLTLIIGPGLIVNGILKSLWGRPRPFNVIEFGGDNPFVAAWHLSDYCASNCSFVSGEAASAIWLVALALVVPQRWRARIAVGAIILATVFSLNRIAFGGHFLSDVLVAWALTLLVMAILYHFLFVRPPRFLEEPILEGGLTRAGLRIRGLLRRGGATAPVATSAGIVAPHGIPSRDEAEAAAIRAEREAEEEAEEHDRYVGVVPPRFGDHPLVDPAPGDDEFGSYWGERGDDVVGDEADEDAAVRAPEVDHEALEARANETPPDVHVPRDMDELAVRGTDEVSTPGDDTAAAGTPAAGKGEDSGPEKRSLNVPPPVHPPENVAGEADETPEEFVAGEEPPPLAWEARANRPFADVLDESFADEADDDEASGLEDHPPRAEDLSASDDEATGSDAAIEVPPVVDLAGNDESEPERPSTPRVDEVGGPGGAELKEDADAELKGASPVAADEIADDAAVSRKTTDMATETPGEHVAPDDDEVPTEERAEHEADDTPEPDEPESEKEADTEAGPERPKSTEA